MELFEKRLANLLTIKSIVTVVMTIVFAVLALRGTITGSDFLAVFSVVIGFYFGTQAEKKSQTENG